MSNQYEYLEINASELLHVIFVRYVNDFDFSPVMFQNHESK
jgi:hypothetical protein